MRKLITICLLFGFIQAQAQDVDMAKNEEIYTAIREMKRAQSSAEYIPVMERLDRVCTAQKDNWIPFYYAALARVFAVLKCSSKDPGAAELMLAGEKKLDAAAKLSQDEEVLLLQAYLKTLRMNGEGGTAYEKYGPAIESLLDKVRNMNGANPRLFLIEGTYRLGLPADRSGGKDGARPFLTEANNLFLNGEQERFPFMPTWGGKIAEDLLKELDTE